ncbi:MAG: hypothetical protein A2W22_00420 [Candidatus Levybacteria bacterium RBG_16_35_11]|nr:MAG: hypothetical protein A2W22_00420 [Candidatus Levybacteria bacterium RBG_16_35_11]
MKNWILTETEKKIVLSLVKKDEEELKTNDKFAIIDSDTFYKSFSEDEKYIFEKYLNFNPQEIRYKLLYLGLEEMPRDIVKIKNQIYFLNGQKRIYYCQYLPKETYLAYCKMNESIQKKLHKKLLVSQGYHSPARHAFIFFENLIEYNFDFIKTVGRVCFPAYSEHVCSRKQAIDFLTQDGIKGEGFEKTREYEWLKENANRFGFSESYPKNNNLEIMWEPWHWHHEN